jgi:hypothetical protein
MRTKRIASVIIAIGMGASALVVANGQPSGERARRGEHVVGNGNVGATDTIVKGPAGGALPTLAPGMDPKPGDVVVFPPAWAAGRAPVLIPAGQANPGPLALWGPSPTP